MNISALTSSLPLPLDEAIKTLAGLGFRWIDVPPTAAGGAAQDQIRRHDLRIASVGLERDMPEAFDLAAEDPHARRAAVQYFRSAIEATAALQAPVGYITPPTATDPQTRAAWRLSLLELAEDAAKHGVELAIEHFPQRLTPSGTDTLALLSELEHPALKLLIDVGHCLISQEDPAELVAAAGERFSYIHFDDNDGQSDLHWPLLHGRLTEHQLQSTLAALHQAGYDRGLCLELNCEHGDAIDNLRQGKALLERLLATSAASPEIG